MKESGLFPVFLCYIIIEVSKMKNISMLIGMILLLISIAINLINNKKKIISKSKKIKYYCF